MFTKKHYIALSQVVGGVKKEISDFRPELRCGADAIMKRLERELVEVFSNDNTSFDCVRFLNAVDKEAKI